MTLSEYRRTVADQQLTFDVTDGGPPDAAEVAVLLHGFPQDRTSWNAVAAGLHAAGVRTLAPDQRGYSPRARPGGRSAYRLSELVADVVALVDAAGLQRVHVVGHDWGGAVAWALAARHPDRVASLTVLSTPHPRAMMQAVRHSTQGLKSWYMLLFQLPLLPEALLAPTLERSLTRSGLSAASARHSAELMRAGALGPALGWYRALPASLREKAARRVTVPTTYVWGSRDFALGRTAAEATADGVTGPYRFVELDAGHWLPEERADDVVAAVLERVHPAGGTA